MGVARGGGEPPPPGTTGSRLKGKALCLEQHLCYLLSSSPPCWEDGLLPHFTEEKMEAEGADGTCPGSYSENRADT